MDLFRKWPGLFVAFLFLDLAATVNVPPIFVNVVHNLGIFFQRTPCQELRVGGYNDNGVDGDSVNIPTTLDGPFEPRTVAFDSSLRKGSEDLPHSDPRLVKHVPSIYPEQIALALSTPDSMWISWITGVSQIGRKVAPLDPSTVASEVHYGTESGNYTWIGPKVAPLDPSTVASEVHYGTESGNYTWVVHGTSLVYSQIYPYDGLLNYTSGIIHHTRLEGLAPNTTYFYRCGDSSLFALSEERKFTTFLQPSPDNYPARIAVVGDLGLTYNSTSTFDHIQRNNPSLLLMIGDLSYANQYLTTGEKGVSCYSCSFPNSPTRETYQPHWDAWGRFMEPLVSSVPMMVIEGNHEIEAQDGNETFASYKARFSVPAHESGSENSLFYSFNAGGIHFIMLGGYVDYNRTGQQYKWIQSDLQKVNRETTPWLIAAFHPPWYNSYSSHYREFECMRLEMEDLLYEYGVDVVFSGHVHAYERSNRVYRYDLDPCGPLYVTIGDGGNIEQIDTTHADDPGQCPSPEDNIPEFGGICPFNFTTGPAAGSYCWERQPEWSALRDSSFGHGILEVHNFTHAVWTWHRNQDVYGEDKVGDQIYIVRTPDKCQIKIPGTKSNSKDY